jgi:hypothetical protein
VISLVASLFAFSNAAGNVLYDVSFSSPPHTLNQPSATGGPGPPFAAPTQRVFGTSEVVSSGGGLNDQPLLLIPQQVNIFQYSQYQFNIGPGSVFQLDFDLSLNDMADDPDDTLSTGPDEDRFAVLFDAPTAVRLDFWDAGRISQKNQQIGTFVQGQPFHMSVLVSLPQNQWTIWKDGLELFSGQFAAASPGQPIPPTELRTIRINLADAGSLANSPVAYIDNIRIIPEPRVGFLFAAGAAAVCYLRRRQRQV